MSDKLHPKLQFQSINLDKSINSQSRVQEIRVNEGQFKIDGVENIKFPSAAGGTSFHTQNITRNIIWKTNENTLSLSEYSLDVDLLPNNVEIVFNDSILLPNVVIRVVSNHVVIIICTIHAAHFISIDLGKYSVPKILALDRPITSILNSVLDFDFTNFNQNSFYSESLAGICLGFTAEANYVNSKNSMETLFAINTNTNNMILLKMTTADAPSQTTLTQASRISRLFSGINPWAGDGLSEGVSDMGMLKLTNKTLCLLAICKDIKIRSWCCQTQTAFAPVDLSRHLPDLNLKDEMQIDQKIRTSSSSNRFVVHIGTHEQAFFLQFQVTPRDNFEIQYLTTISVSNKSAGGLSRHLVDFTFSRQHIVRALWVDAEDQNEMSVFDADVGISHPVAMQPSPSNEPQLTSSLDTKRAIDEAYINYIFTPGRFCMRAVYKALTVPHRHTMACMQRDIQWFQLKDQVQEHINSFLLETFPEMEEEDFEEDEDFLEQHELVWNDFYQSCVQYQQSLTIAVGLTDNCYYDDRKSESLAFVVQKAGLSVLSPVSALEAVCRNSDVNILKGIIPEEVCTVDNLSDLSNLLKCLGSLVQVLDSELLEMIQNEIEKSAMESSKQSEGFSLTLQEFLNSLPPEKTKLDEHLSLISDISKSFEILLSLLEPTIFGVEITEADSSLNLSGSCGIELLTQCVTGHIQNRLQLVLLLYVLCLLFNRSEKKFAESCDTAKLMSDVVTCARVYIAIKWLSQAQVFQLPPSTLESTLQTLSMYDQQSNISQSRYSYFQSRSVTILEFFVSLEGSRLLHKFLKSRKLHDHPSTALECLHHREHSMEITADILPAAANFFVYLMWPQDIGVSFVDPLGHGLALPDFMLNSGQWKGLMTYLEKKLQPWCVWSTASRQYMLAHCYLHDQQYDKALHAFISASSEAHQEEFLCSRLFVEEDVTNSSQNEIQITYYTKILPIFKKFELLEYVIRLAHHAVQCADEQDPNLPSLWSSIFYENLELGEYKEAYSAIKSNPNAEYRKDCLRAFVVALCESKKYNTLVEFAFDNLEEELVNIIMQRARCTDLVMAAHPYYDILYCFHIHRRNYRKAAITMYEQCWRLSCEFTSSISVLNKQQVCILACINCLHLVAPGNQWIVHPGTGLTSRKEAINSPKHDYEGNEVEPNNEHKVIIKELKDIQKECLLIEMKLKIEIYSQENCENFQSSASSLATPNDYASVLCHLGLYDDAILILHKFDLPLVSVFESLTQRCVKLGYADEEGKSDAWLWIRENSLLEEHHGNQQQWSAVDAAFRLLQVYLDKYGDEPQRGTSYHKAVAMGILGLSGNLPQWFVNNYKKRNCAELLRLLVCFDHLEEATYLMCDYVDAAMGVDADKFGVKHPVSNFITSYEPSWIPYTVIDQLHYILNLQRTQKHFDQLYHIVDAKVEQYFALCKRVSGEMQSIVRQDSIIMNKL